MPYLLEGSEITQSWTLGLTEAGNMGHIVPGHNYILELVYMATMLIMSYHKHNYIATRIKV